MKLHKESFKSAFMEALWDLEAMFQTFYDTVKDNYCRA